MDKTIRLENWSVVNVGNEPYLAPEMLPPRLRGECYGHPGHSDGKTIYSSVIVGLGPDGTVRVASGKCYALGAVDSEYERQYPDARRRLLESIR